MLLGQSLGDLPFSLLPAHPGDGKVAMSNLLPAPPRINPRDGSSVPNISSSATSPPKKDLSGPQRAFDLKIEKREKQKKDHQHQKFMTNHNLLEKVVSSRKEKPVRGQPRQSPGAETSLNLELRDLDDLRSLLQ